MKRTNTENKYSDSDKRKFLRVKENMLMSYSLDTDPYTEFKAIVYDMNINGLRFATEMNIVPQTKLSLEVFQSFGRDKTMILSIPIKAETVWIRKIIKKKTCCEGENVYEVGIKITEIKGEDRCRIAKYVEEFNL